MRCDALHLLNPLSAAAHATRDRTALGEVLVGLLAEAFPQASWVGIYWLADRELRLGPFRGAPTEHVRIPVGQGVCGKAVEENADQVVPDVRAIPHYLSCSAAVRSEIVVLVRARGHVVGQLDLDSELPAAFEDDDHCVLRAVADAFGALLETTD